MKSKNTLIRKISISLFIVVLFTIIMHFLFLRTTHPTLSGYFCNIATEILGVIVTLFFIQRIFDTFEENKFKKEELCKILRYNEVISIYIEDYIKHFHCVTTPIDERFKNVVFPSEFKIQDLSDLYFAPALITSSLSKPAIEVFYIYEQGLRNLFMNTINNIDFKYYAKIRELMLEYIKISLKYDVSDAIISYRKVENAEKDVRAMLKSDYIDSHYLKFKQNRLGANIATPYFILFDMLQKEQNVIQKYCNKIEEIKKEIYPN